MQLDSTQQALSRINIKQIILIAIILYCIFYTMPKINILFFCNLEFPDIGHWQSRNSGFKFSNPKTFDPCVGLRCFTDRSDLQVSQQKISYTREIFVSPIIISRVCPEAPLPVNQFAPDLAHVRNRLADVNKCADFLVDESNVASVDLG